MGSEITITKTYTYKHANLKKNPKYKDFKNMQQKVYGRLFKNINTNSTLNQDSSQSHKLTTEYTYYLT